MPTKKNCIDRLRDGLYREIMKGLVTLRPTKIQELVEVTQSFKVVLNNQSQGLQE